MKKIIISLKEWFQSIGIANAKKAIDIATKISKYRTENLILYGQPYKNTIEFKRLELVEKWQILKSEIIIAFFRIKL